MSINLTQKLIIVFVLIISISAFNSETQNLKSQKDIYSELINQTVSETLKLREENLNWVQSIQTKHFNLSSAETTGQKIQLKKIEGIIPASFEKVIKYYNEAFDNSQYARNKECGSQLLIEKLDESSLITLYRGDGNAFISPREHLSIQNKIQLNESQILITRTTLSEYYKVKTDPQAIRINGIYSIFLKKISDNETHFLSYYRFDIGYVPYIFMNMASEKRINVLENDIEFINKIN
ncbi:mammalian STARD1-STARD15-like lipid-binding START domain protein, putative (macronuclear) [Tetrahymena thermophila SB210]|uniref:Mammalian STARD1-STARD15-like lipid-binding START domain protein, putative n=1 Tax=Tetrahymena thermophila (strain SB210) TaxID=312017 RepID=I7MF15_TETTS|nr:mammalian STARD1-STARD15-like lipid-binding START domain protein, putative [Tetrahymena thermophila SB210]EAR98302.1 mammalian STARD1-STARD15-like lipid-binding START domain protein, putative [Tetrahymena thermophila SB210]|eukprot:XP_001018547.1 mammalian STARD1-STARD15-like lipid-binding START domain protein, putative [Tetrahymena thermophila SB210]